MHAPCVYWPTVDRRAGWIGLSTAAYCNSPQVDAGVILPNEMGQLCGSQD